MTSRPRGSPPDVREAGKSGEVGRSLAHSVNVHEGDLIAGKYRVEGVLGVGGTAVVVAARHEQLGHKVAIKLLAPAVAERPEMARRFAREGQAAVRLTSEHVARVFDVGVLDDATPYLVMEHLDGEDLDERLRARGSLPVEEAVDCVMQACVAVAEAHGLGIVHRDIKPANLFCVRRDDGSTLIKVLDFGLAKATLGGPPPPDGSTTTRVGTIMGSPLYMSPEQMVASGQVDARTDIWALGVTLFELLSGRTPFEGSSISQIAHRVMTQAPPTMQTLGASVPPGLEAVIAKCLEKEPERRYASMGELAAALRPFAPEKLGPSVEGIVLRGSSAGPASARVVGATPARAAVSPTKRVALALVAVVCAAGLVEVVRQVANGARRPGPAVIAPVPPAPGPSDPAPASPANAPSAAANAPSAAANAPSAAANAPSAPISTNAALDGPEREGARPPGVGPDGATAAPEPSMRREHPLRTPAAGRPRPPVAPTSNPCDPTFYLDELGRKHFKPECFAKP